ncbi:transposase, partial [Streptomyces sp. YIM 98790]|uniref:transposase n=1 Tax=Streptomyces sp. YIM 98790 TaxID=2689077 RepID=UPI001A9E26C2
MSSHRNCVLHAWLVEAALQRGCLSAGFAGAGSFAAMLRRLEEVAHRYLELRCLEVSGQGPNRMSPRARRESKHVAPPSRYSPEFREEAVHLALKSSRPIAHVARELD